VACGLCSRVTDTYYSAKLHAGLLTDSEHRYHAPPPGQPRFERRTEDGWTRLTGPGDPLTQLLAADGRRELGGHADLAFLR
jgi:hypothetical protein